MRGRKEDFYITFKKESLNERESGRESDAYGQKRYVCTIDENIIGAPKI